MPKLDDEQRLSDDCLCITRVSWDGALIVIADSECEQHSPAILDAGNQVAMPETNEATR